VSDGSCTIDSSRGRPKPFFQFWLKPKVYLRHSTENETETETEHTDLAETETENKTLDFVVKTNP